MLPLEPSLRQGSAPGLEFQVLSSSVNCCWRVAQVHALHPVSRSCLQAQFLCLSAAENRQSINLLPSSMDPQASCYRQSSRPKIPQLAEWNTQQNVKASQTTSLSPVGRSLSQIWEIPHMQRAGLFKGCSCHSSAPCIQVFFGRELPSHLLTSGISQGELQDQGFFWEIHHRISEISKDLSDH